MLDILSMLGSGSRPLFVNPGLLERQLSTEITDRQHVTALVSFASQFDAVLKANPAIDALLAGQQAAAIAALYGAALRIVNERTVAADVNPTMHADSHADFVRLQEEMAQIVRLSQVDIPDPAAETDERTDDAIIDSVLAESLA